MDIPRPAVGIEAAELVVEILIPISIEIGKGDAMAFL